MAYNLPPPWDPGYALPGNVRDEGLERRAFTTQWLPRGTYDAPRVSTGGYVVPQYVLDENIGQGAHVTKWQPRGTYNGPGIPHWLNKRPQVVGERRRRRGGVDVTFSRAPGMGDVPQAPLVAFGELSATAILNRVSRLPPAQRGTALKKALDKLDPTLHKRAGDIARDLNARGVPPAQAVHAGLARALSAGLTAEIIRTGERGTKPAAGSLLGLGCYGSGPFRQALGDDAPASGAPLERGPARPGFTWVDATATASGYWRRLRAGEVGQGPPIVPGTGPAEPEGWCLVDGRHLWKKQSECATPFVEAPEVPRTHGGVTVDGEKPKFSQTQPGDRPPSKTIDILGFKIPIDEKTGRFKFRVHSPNVLSAESRELIRKAWSSAHEARYVQPASSAMIWPNLGKTSPEKDAAWAQFVRPWLDAVGIPDGAPLNSKRAMLAGCSFIFTNPVTKKDWCLRANLRQPDQETGPVLRAVTAPLSLWIVGYEVPEAGVFDRIAGAFSKVNETVHEVVDGVVDVVGSIACSAIQAPGAGAAATAAGGPAGAAGAAVAGAACAKPPPPPAAAPPPAKSILPIALLAGGVVVAAALFSSRRR